MTFHRDKETEAKRPPKPTVDTGKGLTKTNMAKETDINLIMAKYRRTGTVNFLNSQEPVYMEDMVDVDFHQALNQIKDAENMFMEMPAHLRKEFKNDPGEFLEFVHNPENAQKLYDMGLSTKEPVAQETAVEPVAQETAVEATPPPAPETPA